MKLTLTRQTQLHTYDMNSKMMNTILPSAPVMTILSSSVAASRRSQEVLHALFGLEPVSIDLEQGDELNQKSGSLFFKNSWDSLTCRCPDSGVLVHLLSPAMSYVLPSSKRDARFSLLSISANAGHGPNSSVGHARSLLAAQLRQQKWWIPTIGSSLKASQILASQGGLPLLEFPIDDAGINQAKAIPLAASSGLKEITIPFFFDTTYSNGMTLQSTLSSSILARPGVGMYQWPSSSLVIRPLPAASEDRNLPPPTLIFTCDSLDQAVEDSEKLGARCAKIGFSGTGKGQLVVRHPDLLPGMEVRFCESKGYSSVFAEAQDSLLAGSLGGLQNRNVLQEGGGSTGVDDHRIGVGDCWIEFRATLMNPSGFLRRFQKSRSKAQNTAKAPDLPFE